MSSKTKLEQALEEVIQQHLANIRYTSEVNTVEEALKRALDDTTPERAGSPWKNKPEPKIEEEWV